MSAAGLVAAAGPAVDPSWPAHVHRLSGGNPLFVRELVRLLQAEGALSGPAVDVPVPADLRRLALHRMTSLDPRCQDLFRVGPRGILARHVDVEFDIVARPDR